MGFFRKKIIFGTPLWDLYISEVVFKCIWRSWSKLECGWALNIRMDKTSCSDWSTLNQIPKLELSMNNLNQWKSFFPKLTWNVMSLLIYPWVDDSYLSLILCSMVLFFNLSIPKVQFHTLEAEKKVTGCNNTAVTNNNEEGEMSSECSHHTGNYFKSIYINLLIQSLLIDILNGHTYWMRQQKFTQTNKISYL